MDDTIARQFKGRKVLVTGATGFTGKVLTSKLARAGADIRAIARASSRIGELSSYPVRWFRGDVFDEGLARDATQDVEYIFHLAAAFREVKATEEDYRKIHLYSTRNLATSVAGNPGFKRFLHVSTVGVHGHIPGNDLAGEDYPFAPGDSYQSTKLEGEQWLHCFGKEHDFPYSVIRPAAIYGPGDKRLLKLFRMVNKGFFLMLGGGKGYYHLVHVEDLTNIMLLAAVSDQALGEVFIAASNKPMMLVDIGKTIGRSLGKRVRIIRLPIQPFYWAADFFNAVCPPLGLQPPLYRRRVAFYSKDRKFDNTKLREKLDYQIQFDNETGLAMTADWYREHGWLG